MGCVAGWRVWLVGVLVWVVVVGGVSPVSARVEQPGAAGGLGIAEGVGGFGAGGLLGAVGGGVGALGVDVPALAAARFGSGVSGVRAQGLDQIDRDMIDRLQQKASTEIWKPGFEIWPSSNQYQLVGLRSWFRVEDAAWVGVEVDEEFALSRAVARASEPARVLYEFSDGVYSCGRQGVAWSETALRSESCARGWEHTSEVEPQRVRARLVYDFEWELFENGGLKDTGEFSVSGQWSDWVDLIVGEVGTVASDGSASSMVPPARGVDMVSVFEAAPGGCQWGFLCSVGRGFKSLWNLAAGQWDALSSGVLTLARFVWDLGRGCFANVLDAVNAVKDALVKLKDFASDPVAFVQSQFEVLTQLVAAVQADAPGFATQVLEGVFEVELLRTNEVQWAGKVGCQVALALLTGGGALASKLGGASKLLAKINDFLSSRGLRNLDDVGVRPRDRDRDRGDDDRRDDEDDDGPVVCLTGGGNSFPTGTLVLLGSGAYRPIEMIDPGERVVTYDTDAGLWREQPVLAQWSAVHDGALATVALAAGGSDVAVSSTADHEFWVDSRGAWVEADELQPGDYLLGPVGVTRVEDVTVTGGTGTVVWDLDTAVDDDFVVATSPGIDVLAHNQDDFTPGTFIDEDGVQIRIFSNDHPPPHAHVMIDGQTVTRIGQNGNPLSGDPELSGKAKRVVEANIQQIRSHMGKYMKWYRDNCG